MFYANLSPLIYSGGKEWLLPVIRKWLEFYPEENKWFYEPFLGGGNISLNLINDNLVMMAIIGDLDPDVTAFWEIVFSKKHKLLIDKVFDLEVSKQNVLLQMSKTETKEDIAFNEVLHTRMRHNGIRTGGLRKNLSARYNPDLIEERIVISHQLGKKGIVHLDSKCSLNGGFDANDFFQLFGKTNGYWLIDPPYVEEGKYCYKTFDVNHHEIFQQVSKLKGNWIMTYYEHPLIYKLIKKYGFRYRKINNPNTKRIELIISNDNAWMKRCSHLFISNHIMK